MGNLNTFFGLAAEYILSKKKVEISMDSQLNFFFLVAVKRPLPNIPGDETSPWPVTTCRAIFDRQTTNSNELSFAKGDVLIIVDVDRSWWLVRHPQTFKKGYVPSNYVEPVEWLENQLWYFGCIQRQQAEYLLAMEGNNNGDFLVRKSESKPNTYALSRKLTRTLTESYT